MLLTDDLRGIRLAPILHELECYKRVRNSSIPDVDRVVIDPELYNAADT